MNNRSGKNSSYTEKITISTEMRKVKLIQNNTILINIFET